MNPGRAGVAASVAVGVDKCGAPTSSTFLRHLVAPLTARAIVQRFPQASLFGDGAATIDSIAALDAAPLRALAFFDADPARAPLAVAQAGVVVAPPLTRVELDAGRALILVDDVRALFIDLVEWQLPGAARPPHPAPGIDASAHIAPSANVSALACVGAGVNIGARTNIAPGAVIYGNCHIGDDCVIGPNAVIGHVGLAYHDRADGTRSFFPHLAGVRIGHRVDIGAQSCVCRGMLTHTRIGDDAKLGSLVYVSHGVVVGTRAWISASTAVAGHASVAGDVLLGMGSVVVDNVRIGGGAAVGAGSVVTRNAADGESLVGVPAHPVPGLRRFGPTPRR